MTACKDTSQSEPVMIPSSFGGYDVVIIGAGLGGCYAAKEMSAAGLNVLLVEKNSDILSETCNGTPGRIGNGFHYSKLKTAIKYLRSTLAFIKANPGMAIGADLPRDHPLRSGRYFIMKDSLVPPAELLAVYEELRNEYARLIEEDPALKICEVKDFFRILNPSEYENDVNMDKVAVGIETREELLNWPLFKNYLIEEIDRDENITVLTDTEVVGGSRVIHEGGEHGYEVKLYASNGEEYVTCAPQIVNATWGYSKAINGLMGRHIIPESSTERMKILVEIELPESFANKPSMFFCIGPGAMFSNMAQNESGKLVGRITFAPVTNVECSSDRDMPNYFKRFLTGGMTDSEKEFYGQAILEGVAEYIPGLKQAKVSDVLAGIVKVKDIMRIDDIHKRDASFHERHYSGVEEEAIGFLENSLMKLLYCKTNADEVLDLFMKHRAVAAEIDQHVAEITSKFSDTHQRVMQRTLSTHLREYSRAKDIGTVAETWSERILRESMQVKSLVTEDALSNASISLRETDKPEKLTEGHERSEYTDRARKRSNEEILYDLEINLQKIQTSVSHFLTDGKSIVGFQIEPTIRVR